MRVLVCGSREFDNEREIYTILSFLKELVYADNKTPLLLMQGGAKGADLIAKNWAIENDVPCLDFSAKWTKYGLAAGPLRNKQMIDEGKPDLCLAFPVNGLENSIGTQNMVKQARAAGIRTVVIE
jgi:hypothetical protein